VIWPDKCGPPVRRVMGLFAKHISDTEWLDAVAPLYDAALPVTTALSRTLNSESIQDKIGALQVALQSLPNVTETMKSLPNPTSLEALQAKKSLELALKYYACGARHGAGLFRGGLGECLYPAGWAKRITSQETKFQAFVKKAEKHMERAGVFFSTRL